MKNKRGIIDVHHHIVPKEYVKQLKKIGIKSSIINIFPEWSPKVSLSFMKKEDIGRTFLSFPLRASFRDKKEDSVKISRWCNEYLAKLKKEYSGKFGGFACVPLDFVKESIDELKYALDELKLEGVCLFSDYEDKYLGNEYFDRFFDELNKRKAIVFILPSFLQKEYDKKLGVANHLLEPYFDITRVVTNFVHKRVIERYPNIKFILSYGGGAVPYAAYRISPLAYMQKNKPTSKLKILYELIFKKKPAQGLELLNKLYYSTYGVNGSVAINCLNEFAEGENIIFGSGFPFVSFDFAKNKNINGEDTFQKESLQRIYSLNSLNLFQNLK